MQALVSFGSDFSALDVSGVDDCPSFITDFIASKYSLDSDELWVSGDFPVFTVNFKLRGGKGGFGRAMKQEGERRSRRLPLHKDSCRTISGKRIGSLKAKHRIRELREKIKQLEQKRAEEKADKRQSSLSKELELIEQKQHDMSQTIRDAVEKGLESTPTTASTTSGVCDSDFDILYQNS